MESSNIFSGKKKRKAKGTQEHRWYARQQEQAAPTAPVNLGHPPPQHLRLRLGRSSVETPRPGKAHPPQTCRRPLLPPNLNFKGSVKARVIETLKSSGTSAVITASSPLYRVPVYLSCQRQQKLPSFPFSIPAKRCD